MTVCSARQGPGTGISHFSVTLGGLLYMKVFGALLSHRLLQGRGLVFSFGAVVSSGALPFQGVVKVVRISKIMFSKPEVSKRGWREGVGDQQRTKKIQQKLPPELCSRTHKGG